MTRQQNSSSAAFSIITASPGEEWTTRLNDRSRNYIRKKLKPQFPSASVIAQQNKQKLKQAEVCAVTEKF